MVNCCLKRIVVFHDALYGFTEGRGERTATLESKMAHQLAMILHDPLLQFVLEFCKAYDSLERYWKGIGKVLVPGTLEGIQTGSEPSPTTR